MFPKHVVLFKALPTSFVFYWPASKNKYIKTMYFKIPSLYCLSVIEFTLYESLHLFSSELTSLPQIMSSATTKEQNWHLESCNICWCYTLLAPSSNYSIIQLKREKKNSHIQLGNIAIFFSQAWCKLSPPVSLFHLLPFHPQSESMCFGISCITKIVPLGCMSALRHRKTFRLTLSQKFKT